MPEPYHGDAMHQCLIKPFDFQHTNVVVVSGDGINFCGHTLLNTGGGWYFHIAAIHDVPKFMRTEGYQRYLRENGKRELRREIIKIANPAGSHRKLEEILATQWTWCVLPHNCASFVEDILSAGGSSAGLYSNCPRLEHFT